MEIDESLRPESFADRISDLMAEYHPVDAARAPTLIFEPGRAITSSAQILLLRVLGVKSGARGQNVVIADGGKNITMPLGYEYHEIFVASSVSEAPRECYDLYGPLCHPADILARRKWLPAVTPGATLAVMDAGAYFVPNQMNFSHPRPAAVMVENGEERVIRRRESFEDVIALDAISPAAAYQSEIESKSRASSPVSCARE
jgi:diaminopimelate decarboxylase